MKGTAIPIYEMFDGSKTKLQIPVYQRNYDWKVPNCQQLFDDLVDMVKEDRDTHFFGSIVEIGGDYSSKLQIIDGQQRLTTVYLLILAMVKLLEDGQIEAEDPDLVAEEIEEDYLICRHVKDRENIDHYKFANCKNKLNTYHNIW